MIPSRIQLTPVGEEKTMVKRGSLLLLIRVFYISNPDMVMTHDGGDRKS